LPIATQTPKLPYLAQLTELGHLPMQLTSNSSRAKRQFICRMTQFTQWVKDLPPPMAIRIKKWSPLI
jgi:hypothetical protein